MSFRYYRLFGINTYGGSSFGISEIEMYKSGELIDATDSLPVGAFSASSQYSTTYRAARAFNNIFNENNTGWFSANGLFTNQWICVDFGVPVKINKVVYQADSGNLLTHAVKDYRIEASNDNVKWEIITSGRFKQDNSLQTVNLIKSKILVISQGNPYKHDNINWVNIGSIPTTKVDRDNFYLTHGMDSIAESQLKTLASSLPSGTGKISIAKV
ncbi:discoidin domain-containing protein [Metabacillus fastidiosus]|uniref:discoidin domain-containing protein n=1 Tax=Metabacillus fastidiosus TaxID=1458 RepID=UPI003D279FBB